MPRWLKIIGRVVGVVLVLVVIAVAAMYAVSEHRIHAKYDVAATPVPVGTDSATIAHGKHLVTAVGMCVDCHGENLGGHVFADDKAFGHFSSANLTSGQGGVLREYNDAELARAIRRGVRRDGTSLLFMPSPEFSWFSDADVGAIISYLRSLPPVDHVHDEQKLGPIARMLIVKGNTPILLPASHIGDTVPKLNVTPGPTVEYGKYLAHVAGCHDCHHENLAGGEIPGGAPGWPPSQNITRGNIGTWTEADFFRALREGKRPDGSGINAVMPWRFTKNMTDDELRALWMYLQTIPPVAPQKAS